ncbi:inositol 1,4,5-triphosphate receptor associated 1-like isoform X2 [Scylla paramamosain]|uniref:inositol 1,4,5-triphosphate receptor associated 1-like isoform X2 n=1 Tax=Scylla paramamosain TaxID=85552 RepID=UPI0030830289
MVVVVVVVVRQNTGRQCGFLWWREKEVWGVRYSLSLSHTLSLSLVLSSLPKTPQAPPLARTPTPQPPAKQRTPLPLHWRGRGLAVASGAGGGGSLVAGWRGRREKDPLSSRESPSTPTPVDAAHLSALPGKDSPGKTNLPEKTPVLEATLSPAPPGKLPVISEASPAKTDLPEDIQLPPGKRSPALITKSPVKPIVPNKKQRIISFSDLTNALGIQTPHRGKTRGSSPHLSWNPSPLHGKLPEEGMDVELPVPEHLACLYDVVKAVKNSNENLSPQEIENKFTQLSLAFKTDRLTLRQRLDLQQRHRDTAESNLENEFKHLRSSVLALHADCMDSELVDAVTQVRRHLDVLATSSNRLISTSEVWGAVQQEWRVSRALEVLFLHVDNVKRMYERDHQELVELRRVLKDCQIELPNQGLLANGTGGNNQTSTDSPVASRRLRALSLAICSTKSSDTRRVSVASPSSKSSASGFAGSARSRARRASLMPDLKPFREQLAGLTAAAFVASRESSSSSSSASGLSAPKESAEEGTGGSGTTSGRWSCSITEEVNESGEEDAGSTQDTTSSTTSNAAAAAINNNNEDDDDNTASLPAFTPANIATLGHLHPDFQLEDDLLTDSEERDSDDSGHSEISQAPSEEPKPSLPSFLDRFWARSRPPQWVLVTIEGLIGWAKGGQWPYSQQQTVQGARYAFTSLLLLVAALFLLVTLSSGDASIPQPRHPGWTTMNHLLHPFVTLRYLQTPPT